MCQAVIATVLYVEKNPFDIFFVVVTYASVDFLQGIQHHYGSAFSPLFLFDFSFYFFAHSAGQLPRSVLNYVVSL